MTWCTKFAADKCSHIDNFYREIKKLEAENAELRRRVEELQAKLNLEKCPACDVVERYLQLKQAAQAVVEYTKSDGLICDTPILIDNLAAVLAMDCFSMRKLE